DTLRPVPGERGAHRRRRRLAAGAAAVAIVAGIVAAVILLERGSTVERAVSKPSAPRSSQPQPGIGIVRQGTDAWRAGSGYRAYSYLIVSLDLARRAARE